MRLLTASGPRLAADDGTGVAVWREEEPRDYLAAWRHAASARVSLERWVRDRLDGLERLQTRADALTGPTLPRLLLPFVPPEVWGASYTYAIPRAMGPDPHMPAPDRRPVIFFKATAHRCVGPGEPVGRRGDARLMIPEAELGVVVGGEGQIIGFLACNDVSSRDLPRENPYYMDASKIFARCCALGPAVVPPGAFDPAARRIACRIYREGELLFAGEGTTARLVRPLEELVAWTCAHADVPEGAVLCTGTSISPPADLSLQDGDVVEVEVDGIGTLSNPVVEV